AAVHDGHAGDRVSGHPGGAEADGKNSGCAVPSVIPLGAYRAGVAADLAVVGCLTPQLAVAIAMAQIQTQIELQLVVIRLHITAQLVKRFVVFFFTQMRQFMHENHFNSGSGMRRNSEEIRISCLAFNFPPCTRDTKVCSPSALLITWILSS